MLATAAKALGLVITSAAATVAIWEWASDDAIADADDLLAALEGIQAAIEGPDGIVLSTEERAQFQREVNAIAEAAATTSEDTSGASYLRVSSGLFEVERGTTADVELPGGQFASITYISQINEATSRLSFIGEPHGREIGHVFEFPDHPECSLSFNGLATGEDPPALFRFRCAP